MAEEKISAEQVARMEALKRNYTACFSGKAGQEVLKDLKRACFFHDTTIHKDPTIMGGREGRRQVILHVETMMNFSLEKIKKMVIQQQESEE